MNTPMKIIRPLATALGAAAILHVAFAGTTAVPAQADGAIKLEQFTFGPKGISFGAGKEIVLSTVGFLTLTCPEDIKEVSIQLVSNIADHTSSSFWVQDQCFGGRRFNFDKNNRIQEATIRFDDAGEIGFYATGLIKGITLTVARCRITTGSGKVWELGDLLQDRLANYKKPGSGPKIVEPPTAGMTAQMAGEAITLDWLRQRAGVPYDAACRQELDRIERVLKRQEQQLPAAVFVERQRQVRKLREQLGQTTDLKKAYLGIRALKREILLGSPDIDFTRMVCIDNPYVSGGEAYHEVRYRNEDTAVPGGRLLLLDGLGPEAAPAKLAPHGDTASFWRPDLSFDASKVLFCMKTQKGRAYHLYETGIDGKGLRQLTDSDYNDLDPLYLPDGGIAFNTTRANHFLRCGGSMFRMTTLSRCDADGKNIYFLSSNIESDYSPSLTANGQLLYSRWEYVDKEVMRVQSLWRVNPDGTKLSVVWGNQSKWPDFCNYPREIPGGGGILFNPMGHHNVYEGGLGVIRPEEGLNYPDGVYNLTPHLGWPEVGAGPQDKAYSDEWSVPVSFNSFQTPYPVSKDLFLVSARFGRVVPPNQYSLDPRPGNFQLYLGDYDGNMELLYIGHYNILHALPVRSRKAPPVIPSSVAWPGDMQSADHEPKPGLFYSGDVYEGSDIPRGLVKSLRVMEIEAQTYGDGIRRNAEELKLLAGNKMVPKRLAGETMVSLVYDESVKRVLGTVPVEEDGSVYFKAPPLRALYFQLLDKDGRCLQTMRSSTHVMPGEQQGCVGCHETRPIAPPPAKGAALHREPSTIKAPPWGDATVSFPRFVQPVLDKHCVSCHSGANPGGKLDFSFKTLPGSLASVSYANLVFGKDGDGKRGLDASPAGPIFPEATYPNKRFKISTSDTVVPPLTAMSYKSRLMQIVSSGKHHGVQVSNLEEEQIAAWIDALCPYLGLEEILAQPDIEPAEYYRKFSSRLTYSPKMRLAPAVHRAFRQDAFKTQADRLPKDKEGNCMPAVRYENGKRTYVMP